MKKFSFFLIILYCSFQYGPLATDAANCEDQVFPEYPCCGISSYEKPISRIYNSDLAGLNEFPWMVYLNYSKFSVTFNDNIQRGCAGSLINTRWVLTATHCITDNDPDYYKVHLGEWKFYNNPDCITPDICAPDVIIMGIDKVIRHESFVNYGKINDIGLVRLEKSVTYNDYVRPICLPPKEWKGRNFENKMAIFSGWGAIETGFLPLEMRKASMKVINLQECGRLLEFRQSELKLCTLSDNVACLGDSGGPLFLIIPKDKRHNVSHYVQIGVLSSARRNETHCNPQYPNTYGKVASYIDWIKEVIQKHK